MADVGIYGGAGAVRNITEIYAGAGGVKTVKEVYIGQGGSVRKVWPGYTDYGDNVDMLANSMITDGCCFNGDSSFYSSGSVTTSYARTPWTSNNIMRDTTSPSNPTTSSYNYTHYFRTMHMDTRGYGYLLGRFFVWNNSTNQMNVYYRMFLSHNTSGLYTAANVFANPAYASSVISSRGYSDASDSNLNSYGIWILMDISKVQQEDTCIYFGARLSTDLESSQNVALRVDNLTLCKTKPSQSVSATITWG